MAYILFLDYEPKAIKFAAGYFARQGHRTLVLANGQEALPILTKEPPDILVMNLMLPGRDGLEVMRELIREGAVKRPLIILLTTISADGEACRGWTTVPVESYILRHGNWRVVGWQIVLAVEQLLYRRVVTENEPQKQG